jgi:glycosyltransferase involved in cell wall biosynthesis
LIRARVSALAAIADLEVMAPVPWSSATLAFAAGRDHQRVRYSNPYRGLRAHYPRVLPCPRALATIHAALLAVSCAPRLMALRRRFPFDLLDAGSLLPDGIAVAVLATLSGVPFAITIRGDDRGMEAVWQGRHPLARWALRRSALVVASSSEIRERLVSIGVPDSRVAVIPNGVDVERFRRLDRDAARACLGIPASTRLLLHVGRLHRGKNLPALVDALVPLMREEPDVQLAFVGDPDPASNATPDIRAAIGRAGLGGRVLLAGGRPADELVWWYNAADLLCLPVPHDGSLDVVYEAMACGLPGVVVNIQGDRLPSADQRLGILDAPDCASLPAVVGEALRRRWDREAVARQARPRQWSVVAQECYERFASIGTRPTAAS